MVVRHRLGNSSGLRRTLVGTVRLASTTAETESARALTGRTGGRVTVLHAWDGGKSRRGFSAPAARGTRQLHRILGIVDPLTRQGDGGGNGLCFDVVIPSLPGYGFFDQVLFEFLEEKNVGYMKTVKG